MAKQAINMIARVKTKSIGAVATISFIIGGVVVVQKANPQQTTAVTRQPNVAATTAHADSQVGLDSLAVRNAMTARLDALKNISVSFKLDSYYGLGAGLVMKKGHEQSSGNLSFLNGLAMWERIPSQEMIRARHDEGILSERKVIDIWGVDRREQLIVREGGEISGIIEKRASSIGLPNTIVEKGLGLRLQASYDWITPTIIQQLEFTSSEADDVRLRFTQTRGIIHEWILSRKLGYAPVWYRLFVPPNPTASIEIHATDFRNFNGLFLPMSIVMRHVANRFGIPEDRERYEAQIISYKVNDVANSPDRYRMKWPEGALVNDQISGETFTVDIDGRMMNQQEVAVAKLKRASLAATQPSKVPSLQSVTRGGVFLPPSAELSVNEFSSSPIFDMVDLDQLTILDRPPKSNAGDPQTPEEVAQVKNVARSRQQLMRDLGIDLAFVYSSTGEPRDSGWAIFGVDLLLDKMVPSAWDAPDAVAVETAIAMGDPGVVVQGGDGDNLYKLGAESQVPMVFAYRTREGSVGMLRINQLHSTSPRQATIQIMRIAVPATQPTAEK